MARKKKEKKEEVEADESAFQIDNILHGDAKRSLVAVFLVTLAILAVLGFFGAAGVLGRLLDGLFGSIFGVGKWLFPVILLVSAVMLLKRRTTTLADVVKFGGLFVVFVSALGFLHLLSGSALSEYKSLAQAGRGGGFVGYGISALLFALAGKPAGIILLLALFATGMIAAFNVSFVSFTDGVKSSLARLRKPPEEEEGEEGEDASESGEAPAEDEEDASLSLDIAAAVPASESDNALLSANIQNVSFHDEDGEEEAEDEDMEEETEEEPEFEYAHVPVIASAAARRKRRGAQSWKLPGANLLESGSSRGVSGNIERNKEIIQNTFRYFGIEVEPGEVKEGPTVTQYTFRPGMGVKLSRITTLSNDLALALAKHPIRIQAPIPGTSFIGIEVPNESTARVRLKSLLESSEFKKSHSNLTLILGEDVAGHPVVADLRKMPHLLIAGRTGSGKSVCVNSLLLSLLYQNTPEDLRLLLVDPKRVELAAYNDVPHLKSHVIVENKKVVNVLRWAVSEMERRYKVLEQAKARDIVTYQDKVRAGEMKTTVDPETNAAKKEPWENLPSIVIVIDEMADLMVAHGKEVEQVIIRLAQMSRAVGIHLVLATQRPSVEVLTGLIKANIPTRIAFQVTNQIDSRTILDASGAEKLLGAGDMLYAASDGKEIKRVQGVFVADEEVRRVTDFWRDQKDERDEEEEEDFGSGENDITAAINAVDEGGKEDDLYEEAKRIVIETKRASTTYLQTALGIGYPRAARLMHLLEQNSVVGMVGGKKKVLAAGGEEGEDEEEAAEDDPLAEQAKRDSWQM